MSQPEPPSPPRRAWPVFAVYVGAIAAILVFTAVAVDVLTSLFPDVPDAALLQSLPGLIAGSVAASTALLATLLLAVRPLEPAALRLTPGWERGRDLAVMAVGLLALGQALDSLTALAGLDDRGTLALIRRVLAGASGAELFAAVVVLGLAAGAAEEIFFRGFMQTRLRAQWGPRAAVLVTSVCFAILHVDVALVHVALVFGLSLYLGFVAETTGSALPAVVCHVVNNVVFTLQTALGGTVTDRGANAALAVAGAVVTVACLWWVRQAASRSTA